MKITPETYNEVNILLSELRSRDELELICAGCDKEIIRTKAKIQAAIKHNTSMYCTSACASKSRRNAKPYKCKNCGKEVIRNNAAVVGNVFCNRSCSAKYNNKKHPKRELGVHYVDGKKVKSSRSFNNTCKCGKKIWNTSQYCQKCHKDIMKQDADKRFLETTFGEFKQLNSGESYRYYNIIRMGSRRIAERREMEKVCKVCGYDNYVELCHINPISSFPDEATMEEINSPKNLVYLCPNHHKELDLGIINL